MFLLRLISALIGIPIVLGIVYFGGPWYALFLILIVSLGLYEYNSIIKKQNGSVPMIIINYFGATLIIAALFFEQPELIYPLVMLIFFILFTAALFNMEKSSIADSALSLWGMIYLGGLAGYLLMLRMLPDGALYTYILLAGVWIHDTAAYLVGVKWGIRKFSPQISPKKSIEGSMAGIGATVTIFFSISILLPEFARLNPLQAAMLALGIAVFAQLGDLLESAFKRQMQVKDSGGIIPGHGGILDRFDSLFMAAPFVYYFFILLNMA